MFFSFVLPVNTVAIPQMSSIEPKKTFRAVEMLHQDQCNSAARKIGVQVTLFTVNAMHG